MFKRLTRCETDHEVLLGPNGHIGHLRHTDMFHSKGCMFLSQRETRATVLECGVPMHLERPCCVYTQRLDVAAVHDGCDAHRSGALRCWLHMCSCVLYPPYLITLHRQWNYNPRNNDMHGNDWNDESFSWFGHSCVRQVSTLPLMHDIHDLYQGAHVLDTIGRPYAAKTHCTLNMKWLLVRLPICGLYFPANTCCLACCPHSRAKWGYTCQRGLCTARGSSWRALGSRSVVCIRMMSRDRRCPCYWRLRVGACGCGLYACLCGLTGQLVERCRMFFEQLH
jgi:hypothetical protein